VLSRGNRGTRCRKCPPRTVVRTKRKKKGGRSVRKGTGREDDGEEENEKKEKWHLDLEMEIFNLL
jgi:hypothetical protein